MSTRPNIAQSFTFNLIISSFAFCALPFFIQIKLHNVHYWFFAQSVEHLISIYVSYRFMEYIYQVISYVFR